MRLGRRLSSGIAEDPPAAATESTAPPTEAAAPTPAEVRTAETREHAPAHLADR